MDPFGIGITGLGAAGAATFGAFGLAFRARRRRLALQAASELAIAAGTGDVDSGEGPGISAIRRAERDRIEALATTQAELALRLDALTAAGSAPEEKLQAMAGQLLGLIRDKNATLETAMTGLDQLRARMKALEEMGEPAEARGLFEGLKARMGELETRAAAGAAGLEARLAALASGGGASELAERLARLHEARDAGLEAALGRLAPIETRLAGLESGIGAGRETTKRLEAALAALQGEQAQARTEIAALRATAETAPGQVEARVDARVEAVRAELSGRIEAFERAMAARDPQGALDRLAERLEAVQDRLVLIETAENPLAEVSERLSALYAQKDAAVEAMLGRLAPLETRLGDFERELAAKDPRAAIEQLLGRIEALQGRLTLIEAAGSPLAELSDKLSALYAQKDAAVETVLARLAPLEARLQGFERELSVRDPQGALDRFAERLEGVAGRLAAVETTGSPLAEVTETLGSLYAQKEAVVEAVLGRLAPLEAKLAAVEGGLARAAEDDARAAIDGLKAVDGLRARIETLHWNLGETAAGLAALRAEATAGPAATAAVTAAATAAVSAGVSEAADRLAQLFTGKDTGLAALLDRLGPIEDVLGRVARLEAALGRLGHVETGLERFAPLEIALERLAPLESAFERLAPLEARLASLEARDDPEAALAVAGEVAVELAALRADAATQTALFANRLALLEATLPRPAARQVGPAVPPDGMSPDGREASASTGGASDEEEIWALPRIISLHK